MRKNKFTLSESPYKSGCHAEGGAGLYIIHHLDPVAIIEANLVNKLLEPSDTSFCFTYINTDKVAENWQLTLTFCFQNLGAPDVDVHDLLRKSWFWFMAYLKWEDDNIDAANG